MKLNKLINTAWIFVFLFIFASVSAQELREPAEDLIVEVVNYEPTIIPSSLVEEQEVPIYIQLAAIPSTIIQDFNIRYIELDILEQGEVEKDSTVNGTSEQVKKLYYKNHYYKRPPTYSFSDVGVLIVYLKRIASEKDVPKSIDIDFRAKVYYDASVAREIGGGVSGRTLSEETEEQMKSRLSEHAFGNSFYFRVKEIKQDYATFVFYGPNFEDTRQVTVREGQTSETVRLGSGRYDAFRIRLKDVVGPEAEAKLSVDGKEYLVNIDERILDSDWYIESYSIGNPNLFDGKSYVILKNLKSQGYSVVLSSHQDYDSIEKISLKLKEKLGLISGYKGTLCKDSTACKLYEDAGLEEKFDTETMKNALGQLIQDLPSLKLIDISGKKLESGALIKTKFAQNVYNVGDQLGEPVQCGGTTKRCILRSISDEGIYVDVPEEREGKCTARYTFFKEPSRLSCGAEVELVKVIDNKQATFDIVMGPAEQSFSVSDFSVHIPIEKRAISLTPERIDKQIQKTNEYIQKLDKSIEQLQSLTESWTKVCISTAALFTVQAFLKGGKEKTAFAEEVKEKAKEVVEIPEEGSERKPLSEKLGDAEWGSFVYYGTSGGNFELKSFPKNLNNYEVDHSEFVYVKGEVIPIFNLKTVVLIKKEGAAIDTVTFQITELTDTATHYYKLKDESGIYVPNEITSLNSCRMMSEASLVVFDGKNFVIPLTRANQLPAEERNHYYRTFSEGQQLFLVHDEDEKYVDIWSGGNDCLFKGIGGRDDGDERIYSFRDDKWLDKVIRNLGKAKEGNEKFKFEGANYEIDKRKIDTGKKLGCEQVLGPGQCRLLYNACDPVMCPPSRCDFNGVYRVDNVIQSGLIGSLMLCLPNSKDGVVAPVCLTGVLAALKNIRSVLQGYSNCLEAAAFEEKSIGICDRIRSIYVCEIIWKEAYSLLKLRGGILGLVFGSKSNKGGGEYLGNVQTKIDDSKKFLNFFTQDYATSVFASYKGRSSKEIGTEICRSAIYGKYPVVGDIIKEVSHLTDPVQYTAYVEEEPYSITIQKNSRYAVYYHIYAGGQETRYSVYLKKEGKKILVKSLSKTAQGTISPGSFVDESVDFIAESGYNEVCINVNNEENCGFGKIVSSSFGINSVNNYLLEYELSKKITSERECRAESYGLLPNAAVEKVCAKFNPGEGAGQKENQKWAKVGTCGKDESGSSLGDCWMKVGQIKSNPSLLKEVSSSTCENENGFVCAYNEECKSPGRILSNVDIPLQEVEGKRVDLGNMVCCSNKCTVSETYNKAQQLFTLFKQKISTKEKLLFEKASTYAEKECSFGNKEVFDGIQFEPDVGYAPYKDNIGSLSIKENNNLQMFEGLMFSRCGNCLGASQSIENLKNPAWTDDFGFSESEFNRLCRKDTSKIKSIGMQVENFNMDFAVNYNELGEASLRISGKPGSYQINKVTFDKLRLDVKQCNIQKVGEEKTYIASSYDEIKCGFLNVIFDLNDDDMINVDGLDVKISFAQLTPTSKIKEVKMKLGGDLYGNYETKTYPVSYDEFGEALIEIEQGGLYKISEVVFEARAEPKKCTLQRKYGRDPFVEPADSISETQNSCYFEVPIPLTKSYDSEVTRKPILGAYGNQIGDDFTHLSLTSGTEQYALVVINKESVVKSNENLLCELQGLAGENLYFCLRGEIFESTVNNKCSDHYWNPEENRKAVFSSKYGTFTECFNACKGRDPFVEPSGPSKCKISTLGSMIDPVRSFFGSTAV